MRNKSLITVFVVGITAISLTFSCGRNDQTRRSIAIFVPGVLEGSPTYEMMDSGVRKAADAAGIEVKTIEGGFDQASWGPQMTVLASEGRYGLIVTSNAAMSEISAKAAESYPNQDFLVLDGSGLGGPSVNDVVYNHLEQAFLIGYFAGLTTMSGELEGVNDELIVGMIVGQEYPQMNREIRPGFEIGLHTANPDIRLEFRVLGNWYDAEGARELAKGLYSAGADVILTIAGGANEGVVAAAKEEGTYVLWFDSEGTSFAPGTVLASSVIRQEKAAEEWTERWLKGELEMGESTKIGVREGYVDFPLDSKDVRRHVPEAIRTSIRESLERMRSGDLDLRVLDG